MFLSCSLLYPQCLQQCLALSRHKMYTCEMNLFLETKPSAWGREQGGEGKTLFSGILGQFQWSTPAGECRQRGYHRGRLG